MVKSNRQRIRQCRLLKMNVYAKCKNPYIDKNGIAHACGQCLNCRKQKALEWQIRAYHELIENPKAIFITLTYKPKNLKITAKKAMNQYDKRGTLDPEDITKFMKKLRKKTAQKLRYIYCGEYGEQKWRPHYHMIIYGISKEEISREEIEKIWKLGHVDKSEETVTKNVISYIVGYMNKKKPNKALEKEIYEKNNRKAPYLRTSQGLGKEWAMKNKEQWATNGSISYNATQMPIPRYYIKKIQENEGRKIKYKATRIIGGIKQERYDYKVMKNPEGKLTSRINEIQIEKLEKDMETWQEKYKISEEEKQKTEQVTKRELWRRQAYNIQLWNENKDKTNEQLYKEWSYEKKIPIHKKTAKINPSPLKKETIKRLQKIVERKETEKLNGLFGKRDRYETLEDILETNK